MKPALLVLAASIAALSLLVATATADSSSVRSAASAKSLTIHLIEKSSSFHFVDNPPPASKQSFASAGDQFAIASELLNKAHQHAGWLDASCTVARGGTRPHAACTGVFALKGGTIALIADLPLFGNPPTHIAIVGGTGSYEGVSGSVVSRSPGENSRFNFDTVHLVWSS